MNKCFFLYLISVALITSCTDLPATPTASATPTAPAAAVSPTTVSPIPTATASLPVPEAATTSVVAPTPENYGLYNDSDLEI